MPYEIRRIKNGFKVCKKKENKCFSNKPLTLEKAKKQLKAIGMSERINQGGAKPKNMELYNRIKDEVYRKYPKHSLFRSALIVKLYKKLNGEYEGETPKMNIKKWFKQQWISLNDYLRGKIVPCGSSNTQNKYDEYPLCRPIAIAKSLTKDQIEKMIEEKNKLKEKHLKSKDVLGTDAYNIKSTLTGMGKQEILKNINSITGLYLVGSTKRGEDFNDLDFITTNDLNNILEEIKNIYNDVLINKKGKKYISVNINGLNVDVWKAENKNELKTMKIMRTIEKGHNISYRKIAKNIGLTLNDKGLFKGDEKIHFKNEKELRRLIGLGKEQNFEKQLNKIGFNTEKYLKLAQFVAKKRGYDPEKLTISDDGIHKLDYDGTKFGRVNYNDKLIYTWLELNGKIERGTTKKKFTNYRKRAKKVMEATNNKYSPASLSYYIIW